ncbi:hypothetical protein G6K98_31860 [Agrobacterium rhizogenes]|nr:hypothetical protein [Rhizobium rhizogenes]NTH62120.1 hypothetical protein [Rhizobium rhizogenes]NTH93746.1 hypothetical protein [Rhizobium rhizogenes]
MANGNFSRNGRSDTGRDRNQESYGASRDFRQARDGRPDKYRAEDLAESVSGVSHVHNYVRVKIGSETVGGLNR